MKYKIERATHEIVYEYTEIEADSKEDAQTVAEESLETNWHHKDTDVKECTYDIEAMEVEEKCICQCGNEHTIEADS